MSYFPNTLPCFVKLVIDFHNDFIGASARISTPGLCCRWGWGCDKNSTMMTIKYDGDDKKDDDDKNYDIVTLYLPSILINISKVKHKS